MAPEHGQPSELNGPIGRRSGGTARSHRNVALTYTATSNAVHHVGDHLGSRLLICHDRVISDELTVTHYWISLMPVLWRWSVKTGLQVLGGSSFICYERMLMTFKKQQATEVFAAMRTPRLRRARSMSVGAWSLFSSFLGRQKVMKFGSFTAGDDAGWESAGRVGVDWTCH